MQCTIRPKGQDTSFYLRRMGGGARVLGLEEGRGGKGVGGGRLGSLEKELRRENAWGHRAHRIRAIPCPHAPYAPYASRPHWANA